MNESVRGPEDDSREERPRGPAHLPVRAVRSGSALIADRRVSTALSTDVHDDPLAEPESEGFDLRRAWAIILKRKWTVLAFLLIVIAGVTTTTLLTTPIYRASATIQIDRDTLKVIDKGQIDLAEGSDREFYATQYELLRSRALALRVAKEMNLSQHPVVAQMLQPRGLDAFKAWFAGKTASDQPTTHTPRPQAAPARQGDPDKPYAAVIAAGLAIEPIRESRLVKISFDSPDPRFSAAVANAVTDAFTRTTLERRSNASSYAKVFLEERLQATRLKVEDSERQLIEYSQREQIVNVDDRRSLTEQTLQELTAALARAERDRMAREARFEQVRALGGQSMSQVLESPTVQKLKETRANLQAQYQEKLTTFKPAFPLMQQLRGQIAEMDRQIAAETRDQRQSVEAEYRAGLAKERLLKARIDELQGEVLDLQSRSIEYNILKRDLDTNRELYDALLQRYKEVGVAGGVTTNNVSVVDRAEPGWQFKPDLARNLKFALMLGLLGGIGLALLLEYLDDSIKSPEDVEHRLRMPILGIVPLLKSGDPMSALADTRSAFAEAYRSVRTALQFSTSEGVPRVLFITSPAPSEGKTTTAYALAVNFAQLGKRVLLVDADLRNPSIHKLFAISNHKGLSNYLAGDAKSSEVMSATSTRGLLFMPTGPLPPNPAELLAGAKMAALLDLAGEKFDQVIIDGPPVLGLADALIVSNLATGTLLVVGSGATRVGYARGSIKRLLAARAHLLGVVLTKFDAPRGTGYAYGYGYGENPYYGSKALSSSA